MSKVYICDSEFYVPERKHPDYSLNELDIFAFIHAGYYHRTGINPDQEPSFSLSLRKNLQTNKYELFSWHRADDESTKKVLHSYTHLKSALKKATDLWHHYWDDLGKDYVNSDFELRLCSHQYPTKAMLCHH